MGETSYAYVLQHDSTMLRLAIRPHITTSSNIFLSDSGSCRNGSNGDVLMKARLQSFIWAIDPLSRERGRWETKRFMQMALVLPHGKLDSRS